MADVLADTPLVLGLCPRHQQRFYVPIHAHGSLRCPACSEPMMLYTRVEHGELRRAVNNKLRQAVSEALAHARASTNGWTFIPSAYLDKLRANLEGQ